MKPVIDFLLSLFVMLAASIERFMLGNGLILAAIPLYQDLSKYAISVPGAKEGVGWTLFDSVAYAQAGQTQLTFFQIPQGQSSKTFADTNMVAAGQLPAGQSFLIQSVEVRMYSGTVLAKGGVAQYAPTNADDIYNFSKKGWLEMSIQSKLYIQEGPLDRFQPSSGLSIFEALALSYYAGGTATYQEVSVDYARTSGKLYTLASPFLLESNMNFKVTLNWAAAISQTAAGVVFVHLNGVLYRPAQ